MQDASISSHLPDLSSDPLAGIETIKISARDVAVAAVTFVLSLGVLGLALSGKAAFSLILILHLAIGFIPLTLIAFRQWRGGELTIPTFLAIGVLAGGPLGAAAVLGAAISLWRRNPTPERLRGWYDYIMGVVERNDGTRIYEELTAGRTPANPLASVPYFTPILKGNSLDDQQRALGVIGRRFHGDFRPILRLALRNRDGLIRAQAAAIASSLDLKEKSLLWSQGEETSQAEPESEMRSRKGE